MNVEMGLITKRKPHLEGNSKIREFPTRSKMGLTGSPTVAPLHGFGGIRQSVLTNPLPIRIVTENKTTVLSS